MAAGVSLKISSLAPDNSFDYGVGSRVFKFSSATSSPLDDFENILPIKEILLEEARKFLALKLISAWRSLKNDAAFLPDPDNLKSMAQLVHCR